jgi:hypothetical protein
MKNRRLEMPVTNASDEFITVSDDVQKGFFYLENRQFIGPFSSEVEASNEAVKCCTQITASSCRAIYHGSVRLNRNTNLREPMYDMKQIEVIELAVRATA